MTNAERGQQERLAETLLAVGMVSTAGKAQFYARALYAKGVRMAALPSDPVEAQAAVERIEERAEELSAEARAGDSFGARLSRAKKKSEE